LHTKIGDLAISFAFYISAPYQFRSVELDPGRFGAVCPMKAFGRRSRDKDDALSG
jgi:hypothetical protein